MQQQRQQELLLHVHGQQKSLVFHMTRSVFCTHATVGAGTAVVEAAATKQQQQEQQQHVADR